MKVGTAMKECPKCGQLFALDDLMFCRFDGSSLMKEVASAQEAATILFSTGHLNDRFTALEELRRRSESEKLSN